VNPTYFFLHLTQSFSTTDNRQSSSWKLCFFPYREVFFGRGTHDAALLCTNKGRTALTLATLRTQRLSLSLAAGMCCLLLGLNRPNYLPGVLLVFLAIVVRAGKARLPDAEWSKSWNSVQMIFSRTFGVRQMALPAVFLCGFLGLWSPWIARNYVNYGEFTPTSSSGYLAIVWEQGVARLRIGRYESLKLADGSEFSNFGITNVIEEWKRLPIAAERSRFTRMLASAWLAANWMDIPHVMLWRLRHILLNRGADGLTKLSQGRVVQLSKYGRSVPVPGRRLDKCAPSG
jgi:hypothetical protein